MLKLRLQRSTKLLVGSGIRYHQFFHNINDLRGALEEHRRTHIRILKE